jgi:hypothetical protein
MARGMIFGLRGELGKKAALPFEKRSKNFRDAVAVLLGESATASEKFSGSPFFKKEPLPFYRN